MSETKTKQIIEDAKATKTKNKKVDNLFPLTTQALEVLSNIYSMSEEEYQTVTSRDREIAERPMLFVAQKLFSEFGYELTNELIKYIAILNGLNINVNNGNWIIKIDNEREDIQ